MRLLDAVRSDLVFRHVLKDLQQQMSPCQALAPLRWVRIKRSARCGRTVIATSKPPAVHYGL